MPSLDRCFRSGFFRRGLRVASAGVVLVGLGLASAVCAIAPYNDYVVYNSFIVGNYLPVVVVLAFFLLVVVVNAPLHRWAPGRALTSGEMAVIESPKR